MGDRKAQKNARPVSFMKAFVDLASLKYCSHQIQHPFDVRGVFIESEPFRTRQLERSSDKVEASCVKSGRKISSVSAPLVSPDLTLATHARASSIDPSISPRM